PLGSRWNKMIAGTMDVPAPAGFWEPLRQTIVTNLLGYLPSPSPYDSDSASHSHSPSNSHSHSHSHSDLDLDHDHDHDHDHDQEREDEEDHDQTQTPAQKPLVTYISRQHANARRLRVEDHEALLRALGDLAAQGLCVFREARMEEMSLREQVELAARSTVSCFRALLVVWDLGFGGLVVW
ncbi:hypothetical protein C0992_002021, partial [Termitomyces sp. T32_za158]